MNKINITIRDEGISDLTAIDMVKQVIEMGKVSENTKGDKFYCWCTSFTNNLYVSVSGRAKHPTFIIWRKKAQ